MLHSRLVLFFLYIFLPSSLPYIAPGIIQSNFPSHFHVYLCLVSRYHKCVYPLLGMHWLVHSQYFFSCFPPSRFSVVYHAVDLLYFDIVLDGIPMFFFPLERNSLWGPMCGVIFGVLLEHFTLLGGVSGAMHQTCFVTG